MRTARMRTALDPFSFVVTFVAGWMNQHQHHVIDYLAEENRVLREQIGTRRIRFSDDQRRRLAAKAKKLGRKVLSSGCDYRDSGDSVGLARRRSEPQGGGRTHRTETTGSLNPPDAVTVFIDWP